MKKNKYNAIVFKDKKEGTISMVYNGVGGPIISGKNYQDVKNKFIIAMELAEAVRKVAIYQR